MGTRSPVNGIFQTSTEFWYWDICMKSDEAIKAKFPRSNLCLETETNHQRMAASADGLWTKSMVWKWNSSFCVHSNFLDFHLFDQYFFLDTGMYRQALCSQNWVVQFQFWVKKKRSLLNSIQNTWSKARSREHSKQRGKEVARWAVTEGSTLKPWWRGRLYSKSNWKLLEDFKERVAWSDSCC